jgi:hypothetical protein
MGCVVPKLRGSGKVVSGPPHTTSDSGVHVARSLMAYVPNVVTPLCL